MEDVRKIGVLKPALGEKFIHIFDAYFINVYIFETCLIKIHMLDVRKPSALLLSSHIRARARTHTHTHTRRTMGHPAHVWSSGTCMHFHQASADRYNHPP